MITAAFLRENGAENTLRLQPFIRSSVGHFRSLGYPHLDTLTITGPFNGTGPGDTPSRRRIFVCRPTSPHEKTRVRRKFCRHAGAARISAAGDGRRISHVLMDFLPKRSRRGSFDQASKWRCSGCWRARSSCSASSATREHPRPAPCIASATSSWRPGCRSSCGAAFPTMSCCDLASSGQAEEPGRARAAGAADARRSAARRAGRQFRRPVAAAAQPANRDSELDEFPDFDDNLRQAFQRETELFFESIMHEDRSVLDLLTANYTFVNERLAQHYGIPNIYGSHFRRVTVTDESAEGLLGRAASDGDLARRPDFARAAGQVGSG